MYEEQLGEWRIDMSTLLLVKKASLIDYMIGIGSLLPFSRRSISKQRFLRKTTGGRLGWHDMGVGVGAKALFFQVKNILEYSK